MQSHRRHLRASVVALLISDASTEESGRRRRPRAARRRQSYALRRLATALREGDPLAGRAPDAVDVFLRYLTANTTSEDAGLQSGDARLRADLHEDLRSLPDQADAARDRLCAAATAGNPAATAAALEAGYLPTADPDRAAFLVSTGQWDRYDDLDLNHRLLPLSYTTADPDIRAILRNTARRAGRTDILRALLATDHDIAPATTTTQAAIAMTDRTAETDYLVDALVTAGHPEAVWDLIYRLPFTGAVRAIGRLHATGWAPSRPADARHYETLAAKCVHLDPAVVTRASTLQPARRLREQTTDYDPELPVLGDDSMDFPTRVAVDGDTVTAWNSQSLVLERWDVTTGRKLWQSAFPGPRPWIQPDGRGHTFAFGHHDSERLAVFDVDGAYRTFGGRGFAIAAPAGDGTVLTITSVGSVRRWSVEGETGRSWLLSSVKARLLLAKGAVSPDGRLLCVLSGGRFPYQFVSVQDAPGRRAGLPLHMKLVIQPEHNKIGKIAFAPDSRSLLAVETGTRGRAFTWLSPQFGDGPTLTDRAPWPDDLPVRNLVAIPGRSAVAVHRFDNTLEIRRWPDGRLLGRATAPDIAALHVSPNGGLLAAEHSDSLAISLWRLFPAMFHGPLAETRPADLATVEALRADPTTAEQRPGLDAMAALLRYRFQHDIETGDAVSSPATGTQALRPSLRAYDVELGGP